MPSCLAPVHDSGCGAEVRTECVPPNSAGMGGSSWSHPDRFVNWRPHDQPSRNERQVSPLDPYVDPCTAR
eukprot:3351312-Prymnesium_polylepis.1